MDERIDPNLPPETRQDFQDFLNGLDELMASNPHHATNADSTPSPGESTRVYDKGKWHAGGEYPEDLEPERGSTHIAMYLAWAVENNHIAPAFANDDIIAQFRNRQASLLELIEWFDDVLASDLLTPEAASFSDRYYDGEQEPLYFSDYSNLLTADLPTIYHVQPTIENYERIKPVIQQRFEAWKHNNNTL